MEVVKWVVIGIVGLNAVFFGTLAVIFAIDEKRKEKRDEHGEAG